MQIDAQASPLVSIIIPFYNQPLFLAEAVESARRQTYPNVEIIVVDDGSPVPAAMVLESAETVRIIRTVNQERSKARNFGCEQSHGDFLIFLDSDDRLRPNAVATHLSLLTAHPQAALSFGAASTVNSEGHETAPSHVCRPRREYFTMLLQGNPVTCPGATMIRRSAFLEAGGFDPTLRMAEDYLLYLHIARRHTIVRSTAWVVEYRHHANSTSQDKERMLENTLAVLDRFAGEVTLTRTQGRSLRFGRKRWTHEFRRKKTLLYRLKSLYYSFRAMLSVPWMSYIGNSRA